MQLATRAAARSREARTSATSSPDRRPTSRTEASDPPRMEVLTMILQETYTLSNGVEIPRLGLGTWLMSNEDVRQAVKDAVRLGYRHIDTAQAYGNEHGVGEAI